MGKYLTRPNTTVLAAVRNPDSDDSQSLQNLTAATGSRVILLKVDSTSDTDALEAIEFVKSQGITAIDTVVANAGTFTPDAYQPVAEVGLAHVKDHLDINTVGPVRLFQAVFPLLKKSQNAKFLVISSLVGTIGGLKDIPYPNAAYGASKAAVNFFTRKIHFENEDIVTLAVHPGYVEGDLYSKHFTNITILVPSRQYLAMKPARRLGFPRHS